MLIVKKPIRFHGDVFFYIEGEHLLKVNWLTNLDQDWSEGL
jgi:hypothetical protein